MGRLPANHFLNSTNSPRPKQNTQIAAERSGELWESNKSEETQIYFLQNNEKKML